MKKAINREHIEGYVYEHNLAIKTVQNTESKNYGKEFINGTLDKLFTIILRLFVLYCLNC